jgi:hypothetical protein
MARLPYQMSTTSKSSPIVAPITRPIEVTCPCCHTELVIRQEFRLLCIVKPRLPEAKAPATSTASDPPETATAPEATAPEAKAPAPTVDLETEACGKERYLPPSSGPCF